MIWSLVWLVKALCQKIFLKEVNRQGKTWWGNLEVQRDENISHSRSVSVGSETQVSKFIEYDSSDKASLSMYQLIFCVSQDKQIQRAKQNWVPDFHIIYEGFDEKGFFFKLTLVQCCELNTHWC